MSAEKFRLSWDEFGRNVEGTFKSLLNDHNFTDVTLVSADSKQVKAHKAVLSSSSNFFKQILLKNPHQHPLLFLNGIQHSDLVAIVKFIYVGQTEVAQEDINHFMDAAQVLQIQGLNEEKQLEHVTNLRNETKNIEPFKVSDGFNTSFNSSGSSLPPIGRSLTPNGLTLPSSNLSLPPIGNYDQEYTEGFNQYDQYQEQKWSQYPNYSRNLGSLPSNNYSSFPPKMGLNDSSRFSCDQCDRDYSTKSNLQSHVHSKHEGRRYYCDECDYDAGATAKLSQHKSRFHAS